MSRSKFLSLETNLWTESSLANHYESDAKRQHDERVQSERNRLLVEQDKLGCMLRMMERGWPADEAKQDAEEVKVMQKLRREFADNRKALQDVGTTTHRPIAPWACVCLWTSTYVEPNGDR